jgi:hypothetical protein
MPRAARLFTERRDLRYNRSMACKAFLALLACAFLVLGCHKADPAATTSVSDSQSGGGTAVTPDVGAVTPVTHTSLDDVSGGGVNSAMMKKAKKVAGEGVGSVNSDQKAYGSANADDGG